MKNPEEYMNDHGVILNRNSFAKLICEVQGDSYNQAVDDSKRLVNGLSIDDSSIKHIAGLIESLRIK